MNEADTSHLARHLKVRFDHFEKDVMLIALHYQRGSTVPVCTRSIPMTLAEVRHRIIMEFQSRMQMFRVKIREGCN
jgi:hypothetical protein